MTRTSFCQLCLNYCDTLKLTNILKYHERIEILVSVELNPVAARKCLEGAILTSKLFYDTKTSEGLDDRIFDGFETLITAVEDKLEVAAMEQSM